jgi:hypothetical protein
MNKLRKNFAIILITLIFIGCKDSTQNEQPNTSTEINPTEVTENKNSIKAVTDEIKIVDSQFYFGDVVIPPGCLAQLTTELNGDNVQATIYLEKNSLRGCLDANEPYSGAAIDSLRYAIGEQLPDNTYKITLNKVYKEGSLRTSEDKILIQFVYKPYQLKDGTKKMVLSIDKLGDW